MEGPSCQLRPLEVPGKSLVSKAGVNSTSPYRFRLQLGDSSRGSADFWHCGPEPG